MKKNVSVKTITEKEHSSGDFSVLCFADKNIDGSTTPDIYKAQVLDGVKVIDNTLVKEGELAISMTEGSNAHINESGELILSVSGSDDVERYNKEDENLIYER